MDGATDRTGPTQLKLKAADAEDFGIVSAFLQDALIAVGDIAYMPQDRRFVLVANRFRWEAMPCEEAEELGETDCFERVHSGLRFENVSAVRTRGLDALDAGQLLALLAIDLEADAVTLVFAGDIAIRIEGAPTLCFLEDFGEPWPTKWRPKHPLEAPDGTR